MDSIGLECINGTAQYTNVYTVTTVVKIVALGLIDLVVVLGNSLVIAAVITTRKLRTVTNIFIVSLACADLMLGFAVMPFSISLEIVKIWLWGSVWCSMWLAIDVWLCTASILSLCAISFDRYIAVTHPIRYPSLISPLRGKVLVLCVWILSFVICLPPLLGWNDGSDTSGQYDSKQNGSLEFAATSAFYTLGDTSTLVPSNHILNGKLLSNISYVTNISKQCQIESPVCELTPTKGYRIYAAVGSFFLPSLVMVFFYLRIYLTAMKTAASLRSGVLLTRTSNDFAQHQGGSSDDAIQLRIHRGGSTTSSMYGHKRHSSHDMARYQRGSHDRYKQPSLSPNMARDTSNHIGDTVDCTSHNDISENKTRDNNNAHQKCYSVMLWTSVGQRKGQVRLKCEQKNSDDKQTEQLLNKKDRHLNDSKGSKLNINLKTSPKKCKLLIRDSKTYSSKGHARKFRRETKAAKTLAIIVGAFIVCWCPFFTIYLLGAFCYDCVSDVIFSIFFWLGYINSALNPCIYALFARDFRAAFRRVLMCNRRAGFNKAARADYVTGIRKHFTHQQELDSFSD